jgi:hypothetical protein
MSNNDLTFKIDLSDFLDITIYEPIENTVPNDRPYENLSFTNFCNRWLKDLYFQRRYVSNQFNSSESKFDTACDNAERIFGNDSVMEQPAVQDAFAYKTQYERRLITINTAIKDLTEMFLSVQRGEETPELITEKNFDAEVKKPATRRRGNITEEAKAAMQAAINQSRKKKKAA